LKTSIVLSWMGIAASLVGLAAFFPLENQLAPLLLTAPLFSYAGLATVAAERRRFVKQEATEPPPRQVMVTAVAASAFTSLVLLGVTGYCASGLI
jgi:hypothetical protein